MIQKMGIQINKANSVILRSIHRTEGIHSRQDSGVRARSYSAVSEHGFSMIEVLIGMTLLAIIVVGLVGGLTTSMKSNLVVENNNSAVNIAQSQLENLQSQSYNVAVTNSQGTYSTVNPTASGYFIGSTNRAGTSTENTTYGVPWDTQNGIAVATDAGIQKIRLIVKKGNSWSTGVMAYSVDIYKVQP